MDTSAISSEKYHEQLSQTAYSIGFILGDGSFQQLSEKHQNGKWYSRKNVQIAKMDKDAIERVRDEIEKVFEIKYSIFPRTLESKTIMYHLRAGRCDVFDFFATNTHYKSKIPEFYFSASDSVKRDLIAGLMDSDGYITCNQGKYTQWQLGFAMTNREIVAGMANILRSLGVKVGKLGEYEKGQYRNMFGVTPNIRSFVDAGCFFHSKRKASRLQAYIYHVLGSETMHAASVLTDEDRVLHVAKVT